MLRRTISEFREDNLTDWAAALTYYGILALFPAILALVSIVGLAGSSATQALTENAETLAPGAARDILVDAIAALQQNRGASLVAFVVGLAVALWSASGYVAAFMRASNVIYDVGEGRPIWKTLPTRVLTTLVVLLMIALVAIAVTFTGPLATQAGDALGISSTLVTVWDISKWPIVALIVVTMLALLYWASPNVKHPFKLVTPGAVVGLVLWIVASAAFGFYVANFASYDRVYGSIAGVIVFLVWLWITNIAVLLGAEFNAEVERGRQIDGGAPADREPFLEPRDTRKL